MLISAQGQLALHYFTRGPRLALSLMFLMREEVYDFYLSGTSKLTPEYIH